MLELFREWVTREFYTSKMIRLEALSLMTDEQLVEIIDSVKAYIGAKGTSSIQEVIGCIHEMIPLESMKARVTSAAEILALGAEADEWDIDYGKNIPVTISSREPIKPAKWRHIPRLKPYKVKDFPILKSVNLHNRFINKRVLKILNRIPLQLNQLVLEMEEIAPAKEFEGEILKARELYQEYANTVFYMNHLFDKRGRIYMDGYHINHQSYEYKRALIDFTPEEL